MKLSQLSLPVLLCLGLGACSKEPKSTPPANPPPTPADSGAKSEVPQAKPSAPAAAVVDPANLRAAHTAALAWLVKQQAADGSFGSEGMNAGNRIGLTGLSLMALESAEGSKPAADVSKAIDSAVAFLVSQQDKELGLIGKRVGHSFHYDHAIAAQALCVTLKRSPSDDLRASAQRAVNYISQARNPYGAWRYDYPPTGENDTSVTGWMVEALMSAKAAGLEIDAQSLAGARQWIDEVTDPATGRVGYDSIGSNSSRISGLNDQFTTDHHEAMTASGIVTRVNAGETPETNPAFARHANLLLANLPEWDVGAKMVDEYYWYFGSVAMHRLGGQDWTRWRAAIDKALLAGQEQSGEAKGSWKPVGPWAYSGGAVYSTALNTLSLSTML